MGKAEERLDRVWENIFAAAFVQLYDQHRMTTGQTMAVRVCVEHAAVLADAAIQAFIDSMPKRLYGNDNDRSM